jgi:sugar lactone lactonase YvrE
MQRSIVQCCVIIALFFSLLNQASAETTAASKNRAVATESMPSQRSIGDIEPVAFFSGPMPTGVTVSHEGRIFVNFPRWGDKVDYTVTELKDGETVPFPDAGINRPNKDRPEDSLLSVQSVVVDPKDRLWILDTGRIEFKPSQQGGPKLVGVDLKNNKVFKTIIFPEDVALPTSYLNDVRFDLRRGSQGMAFITDSSGTTPGIIVADLATGKSWRRLTNHHSTKPLSNFRPFVEGQPLMIRPASGKPDYMAVGADGIAVSNDGKRLFYCPLSSLSLYSVSVDDLADPNVPDEKVAATVKHEGCKVASDGLESDADNNIYVTGYDHNAILRRSPDNSYETIVCDPRVLWPDTLALARDGYLYFTANQLHRQPRFHRGKDLRQKPYVLFRVKTDAKPVLLK